MEKVASCKEQNQDNHSLSSRSHKRLAFKIIVTDNRTYASFWAIVCVFLRRWIKMHNYVNTIQYVLLIYNLFNRMIWRRKKNIRVVLASYVVKAKSHKVTGKNHKKMKGICN